MTIEEALSLWRDCPGPRGRRGGRISCDSCPLNWGRDWITGPERGACELFQQIKDILATKECKVNERGDRGTIKAD